MWDFSQIRVALERGGGLDILRTGGSRSTSLSPRGRSLMTDTQWLHIRSFLDAGYVIYVGNAARGHLCMAARCGMTQTGVPSAGCRPRTGRGTRSIAARLLSSVYGKGSWSITQ